MNPEQSVYQTIYDSWEPARYGSSNHGHQHLDKILELTPKSLLDVGCGYNHFSNNLKKLNIKSEGVDFACPGADKIADILNLPYEDKEWEWITAWDVMEHLLPDQVDSALQEMLRVSEYFAFTISYELASTVAPQPFHKHNLHQTIWTPEKWREKIEKYGKIKHHSSDFWVGKWN